MAVFGPKAGTNLQPGLPTKRYRFGCPQAAYYCGHQVRNRQIATLQIRKRKKVAGSFAGAGFHVPGGFAGTKRGLEHFLFPQGHLQPRTSIRVARHDAEPIIQRLKIRFQMRARIKTERSGIILEDIGKIFCQLLVVHSPIEKIIFLKIKDVRLHYGIQGSHHV